MTEDTSLCCDEELEQDLGLSPVDLGNNNSVIIPGSTVTTRRVYAPKPNYDLYCKSSKNKATWCESKLRTVGLVSCQTASGFKLHDGTNSTKNFFERVCKRKSAYEIAKELASFAIMKLQKSIRHGDRRDIKTFHTCIEKFANFALTEFLEEDGRQVVWNREPFESFAMSTRREIILWLLDVCHLFDLSWETIACAVVCVDKLLGNKCIARQILRLFIGTCLWTFSKLNEREPLLRAQVAELIGISSPDLLVICERIILLCLNWNLSLSTPHGEFSKLVFHIVAFHDERNEAWKKVVRIVQHYLNASLLYEELVEYDPQIVLLVALILSMKQVDEETGSISTDSISSRLINITEFVDISIERLWHIAQLLERGFGICENVYK
eukprot:jgi/Galph1/6042/GphlegSOOS_G4700.1